MIYFFSDSHFDKHCGANLYEQFPAGLKARTVFTENQWDILENGEWDRDCELLILNMIATTCGQTHAGEAAEAAVKRYVERGGNILMLHGSSAAFWHWAWWREVCGFRWRSIVVDSCFPALLLHKSATGTSTALPMRQRTALKVNGPT